MSNKRAKLPGAEVLFGNSPTTKQPNVKTLDSQDVEILKHQDTKNVKQEDSKTEEHQPVKPAKKPNVMTTVYFAPNTVKELEKAKVKLLVDYDLKTNKSEIVEVAVKNVLHDINQLSSLLRESKI